jgi:type IV pilus assembly protein PilZ
MTIKDRRKRVEPVGNERRTGRERREHRRVLVSMEVDYRCDKTFLFAYITDLSAMGIFIQTSDPHPPGTLLNLRFQPPGGPQVDVEGRVIWVNPPRKHDSINPGMGVQFVDLTPAQREQIKVLVRTFAYLSDDEDKVRGNS